MCQVDKAWASDNILGCQLDDIWNSLKTQVTKCTCEEFLLIGSYVIGRQLLMESDIRT